MATNTYGSNTSFTFGVPTMTGMVLSSSTLSKKPGISVSVENENGQIIYERRDDVISELSLSASCFTGAVPVVGSVITYNSTKFIVEGTDVKYTNKALVTLDIKGKASEYITLP